MRRPSVRRDRGARRHRGHPLPHPGRLPDRAFPASTSPTTSCTSTCPSFFGALGARAARAHLPDPLRASRGWCVAMTSWGKRDLIEHYGLSAGEGRVVPWGSVLWEYPEPIARGPRRPAPAARACRSAFLLYPAQTWPHKNHEAIARGAGTDQRARGPRGSRGLPRATKNRHFERIERRMRELGLERIDAVPRLRQSARAPRALRARDRRWSSRAASRAGACRSARRSRPACPSRILGDQPARPGRRRGPAVRPGRARADGRVRSCDSGGTRTSARPDRRGRDARLRSSASTTRLASSAPTTAGSLGGRCRSKTVSFWRARPWPSPALMTEANTPRGAPCSRPSACSPIFVSRHQAGVRQPVDRSSSTTSLATSPARPSGSAPPRWSRSPTSAASSAPWTSASPGSRRSSPRSGRRCRSSARGADRSRARSSNPRAEAEMSLAPGSVWLDARGTQSAAHGERGVARYVAEHVACADRGGAGGGRARSGWSRRSRSRPRCGRSKARACCSWRPAARAAGRPVPGIYHVMSPFEMTMTLEDIWPAWVRRGDCPAGGHALRPDPAGDARRLPDGGRPGGTWGPSGRRGSG